MLTQCAVIGHPITHSLSPAIHHYFAKQNNVVLSYNKIQGDDILFEQQVANFFDAQGLGLNVTLPFKQRAYTLAMVRTPRCQAAQAANTLWYKDGWLHADNTDGIGLVTDLSHYGALTSLKILIVGAGGAALGIIPSLLAMKLKQLSVVNRSRSPLMVLQKAFPQIQCRVLEQAKGDFDVIINATSAEALGTSLALPPALFQSQPFCYDLNYHRTQDTAFVRAARDQKCEAVDGLGMLIEQAAESFYVWHHIRPETHLLIASRLACIPEETI